MWKIAVADTAEDHLTLLKDALKAYFQETHRVFSVTSYTDLTFLEKDMAQGEHFDLLILDLVMNGQRSVEAVRRIREKEDGTPLIFLTANREYAVESYEMNALDYMIKPLKKERLVKRLDQLFKRKNPRFSVRTQGDYSYYGYDELVYFEAREHRVYGKSGLRRTDQRSNVVKRRSPCSLQAQKQTKNKGRLPAVCNRKYLFFKGGKGQWKKNGLARWELLWGRFCVS